MGHVPTACWRLVLGLGTIALLHLGHLGSAAQTGEAPTHVIVSNLEVGGSAAMPMQLELAPATVGRGAPWGGGRTLFFGFLEFDCVPDADGNAPGFGPLPQPASAGASAVE
jgi:hypothetical protein